MEVGTNVQEESEVKTFKVIKEKFTRMEIPVETGLKKIVLCEVEDDDFIWVEKPEVSAVVQPGIYTVGFHYENNGIKHPVYRFTNPVGQVELPLKLKSLS